MATHCLPSGPQPPPTPGRAEKQLGAGGKRAQPHRSDSLWSRRHFYLLRTAPISPLQPAARMCPLLHAPRLLRSSFVRT